MHQQITALREHLSRHVDFLRRSCDAYDLGFLDEALRCAVVLRVLFHTTRNQKSLLWQMGAEKIQLLSTCREYEPPTTNPTQLKGNLYSQTRGIFMGLAPIQMGSLGGRHYAMLDNHDVEIWMLFQRWWNQIVFDSPAASRITRKRIVTLAADKDGAHVDPHLTLDYEALKISPNLFYGTGKLVEPLKNAHLPALRQISYEVLKSPELTNLAALPSSSV